MENLKKIPEAKYVMDDLMERTFTAEQSLNNHKKKSIDLIHKIIKDVSLLQIQTTGSYSIDKDLIHKKERSLDNLSKLIELNIK